MSEAAKSVKLETRQMSVSVISPFYLLFVSFASLTLYSFLAFLNMFVFIL